MKRVRSPYMSHLEEERPNLHIKCGNTRTASRTPETYTIFQLGFMDQDAGPADSIIPVTGPCTCSVVLYSVQILPLRRSPVCTGTVQQYSCTAL